MPLTSAGGDGAVVAGEVALVDAAAGQIVLAQADQLTAFTITPVPDRLAVGQGLVALDGPGALEQVWLLRHAADIPALQDGGAVISADGELLPLTRPDHVTPVIVAPAATFSDGPLTPLAFARDLTSALAPAAPIIVIVVPDARDQESLRRLVAKASLAPNLVVASAPGPLLKPLLDQMQVGAAMRGGCLMANPAVLLLGKNGEIVMHEEGHVWTGAVLAQILLRMRG